MTVKYIPLESKSGFKSPGFLVTPDGRIEAESLTLIEALEVPNILVSGVELISGGDSTISLGDGIRHSYLEKLGTLQYLNIDGDFTVSQASTPYISIINGEIRITNPTAITTQLYENISQTTLGVVSVGSGSGAIFTVLRASGTYTVTIVNAGKFFAIDNTILIPGTLLGGETPSNDLTITISAVSLDPLDQDSIDTVDVDGTAVSESNGSMNNVDVGLTTPARGKFTEVTVTGAGEFNSVKVNTLPTEVYHATRKDYVDQRISAFSIAFGG
jgi:hypothetical protein